MHPPTFREVLAMFYALLAALSLHPSSGVPYRDTMDGGISVEDASANQDVANVLAAQHLGNWSLFMQHYEGSMRMPANNPPVGDGYNEEALGDIRHLMQTPDAQQSGDADSVARAKSPDADEKTSSATDSAALAGPGHGTAHASPVQPSRGAAEPLEKAVPRI